MFKFDYYHTEIVVIREVPINYIYLSHLMLSYHE